jgi:uncharacterized membrane protein
MNLPMLVLRLVHIFGGIIWGGGALMMELFIRPSVVATGDAGQKFAGHLINARRVHLFMMASAISTVVAGALLYWIDSGGFTSAWMRSSTGVGFTIGAVFGLTALVFGVIFGNGNARLGQISAQIKDKPTDAQLVQIQAIQKRMKVISPFHVVSMILAMIFMATARYW